MTLPHGFGSPKCNGYTRESCPNCNPHLKDQHLKKVIELPFKRHHIAVAIWFMVQVLPIYVYIMINSKDILYNVIIFVFGYFFTIVFGLMFLSFSDDGIESVYNVFRLIWKYIPKPSHFGYKVKLKE